MTDSRVEELSQVLDNTLNAVMETSEDETWHWSIRAAVEATNKLKQEGVTIPLDILNKLQNLQDMYRARFPREPIGHS